MVGKAPKPLINTPSLKRKASSKDPIHAMHVFSEGKVTEKFYIRKHHKKKRHLLTQIPLFSIQTDCINLESNQTKSARIQLKPQPSSLAVNHIFFNAMRRKSGFFSLQHGCTFVRFPRFFQLASNDIHPNNERQITVRDHAWTQTSRV